MTESNDDVGAALTNPPATPAPAAGGTATDMVELRAERVQVWREAMSDSLTDAERTQRSRRLLQIDNQIFQLEHQAPRPADPRQEVPKTAEAYRLDFGSLAGFGTLPEENRRGYRTWAHGLGFTQGQAEASLKYGALVGKTIRESGSAALKTIQRSRDAQFDALGLTARQRKEAEGLLERWAARVDEDLADEAARRRKVADISGMGAPGHVRR